MSLPWTTVTGVPVLILLMRHKNAAKMIFQKQSLCKWKITDRAFSELALSTASHDTVLRSVEWWIHTFSWYSVSVICIRRRDDVIATLNEVKLNSPPLGRVAKRKTTTKQSKKFNYKNHSIFMSCENKQMIMRTNMKFT